VAGWIFGINPLTILGMLGGGGVDAPVAQGPAQRPPADDKMAAVQFLDEVFLTDGWMVPDRVLWCRQGAENIRAATRRRIPRPRGRKR